MDEKTRNNSRKEAATWLGVGAVLLAIVLVAHGPIHADLEEQMTHIAEEHQNWYFVHWAATVSLICLAVSGFMFAVATMSGRGTGSVAGAWIVLAIGSMITIGTAVAEATAVLWAAQKGDLESFLTWWQFASGLGNGFAVVGLAVGIIAFGTARSDERPMPSRQCWLGSLLGFLSAIAWIAFMEAGIGSVGPIWFGSTLLMSIWLAWVGFRLRATS